MRSGLNGPLPSIGHFPLHADGMVCGATPENPAAASLDDRFRTSVSSQSVLIIERIDSADVWGQHLKLLCCQSGTLQFLGCYSDGAADMLSCGSEALGVGFNTESCRAACAAHAYFALTNSSCCSCGDAYSPARAAFQIADDSEACGEPCEGESGLQPPRWCGGEVSWAVYAHGTACVAPRGVVNVSSEGACLEGTTIAHGGRCTAQCEEDYLPSHWSLRCEAAQFVPSPTFQCIEILGNCTAPTVELGNSDGTCLEGDNLAHGGTCTTQCHPHYTPTIARLRCLDGALSPATFACFPTPCDAPNPIRLEYTTGTVLHLAAYTTCAEGPSVPHLGACTPVCGSGHRLVLADLPPDGRLGCVGGELSPARFTCTPACLEDSDCSGHGTCEALRPGSKKFCRCGYFIEPGAAWIYRSIDLGDPGTGVAVTDGRGGEGFLLYSEEPVAARFGQYALPSTAAPHLLAVVFSGLQWSYDNNLELKAFEPRSTDVLLAELDFRTGSAAPLSDQTLGLDAFGGVRRGVWERQGLEIVMNSSSFDTHYCNPQVFDLPGAARTASSGDPALGQLGSSSGWVPASATLSEWYVIDAGSVQYLPGMVIKGRADADQWLTTFYLEASLNGIDWNELWADGTTREFTANSDRNSMVLIEFASTFATRYLRIAPRTWNPGVPTPPALRVGLYMCAGDPSGGELSVSSGGRVIVIERCARPQLQDPPDSSRSASSVRGGDAPGSGHHRGQLSSYAGWTADVGAVAGEDLWYELDLAGPEQVRAVVIKGHADGDSWATTLSLRSSLDRVEWVALADGRVFAGNSDNDTEVVLELGVPLAARYIRIYPLTWHNEPALRAGVIVCQEPAEAAAPIPAYSGAMCSARPGNEWALFTAMPLEHYWEVRELRFFGDADCSWPLDVSLPISSGAALIERSKVTRGPVTHAAANVVDGKSHTTWVSTCAFPCEAGGAYIGLRVNTPAAVRCVWLEQHGDPGRTATAVELRVRTDAHSAWMPQTSWYGLHRTCRGGASCALAVFSA